MGLWIGLIWIGFGVFFLISEWTCQAAFTIPKTRISWGWLIVALGIWRTWWWWVSVEKPRRRRLAFNADRRQMELEIEQDMAAAHEAEAEKTDKS